MAAKKMYGSSRAFTEGHLEVIGDQSEKTNPSPAPLSAKQLASYATQRAQNAVPWAERKSNDIHAQDPSFKARLSRWESNQGGNNIHGSPKPVYYGKDRGGNEYQSYNQGGGGRGGQGGAPTGNSAANRVNQGRWADDRDGSPLSRRDQLLYDRKQSGELTKRQKADQKIDQYAANQPLARNELQEGIKGNFGSLGNFFNKDD